jgi:hypothetical protein
MKAWRSILGVIVWLTRFVGATVAVGGLGLSVFVAWPERSTTLAAVGLVAIAAGALIMAIRATANGGVEYRLFRSIR